MYGEFLTWDWPTLPWQRVVAAGVGAIAQAAAGWRH
jgi:hypothetical protein